MGVSRLEYRTRILQAADRISLTDHLQATLIKLVT